jgi:hypothetical protein
VEHFVSCHPDSRLRKYGRILYRNSVVECVRLYRKNWPARRLHVTGSRRPWTWVALLVALVCVCCFGCWRALGTFLGNFNSGGDVATRFDTYSPAGTRTRTVARRPPKLNEVSGWPTGALLGRSHR